MIRTDLHEVADALLAGRHETEVKSMVGRVVAVCLAAGCLVIACSGHSRTYPGPASPGGNPASLAGTATRGGELNALTARGVVNALNSTGFAAPHPVDNTAQECPSVGCEQSIVTDTVRVKSFSSTGQAETYASDHGLHQVETVVVEFASPVPKAEQDRYWAHIELLMQ